MKNKATPSKAWTTVQIARHPERPQFLDYVGEIFTEFDALHGDRLYGDDGAMIGGLARFDGQPVMIVGQHRGRSTREKLQHNFGMSNPEGYRKAQRLLDMAERFNLPVFTFIDTMGAYPGVGAEERGQAEAIASSLAQLSNLKVPVIATVLGEGGSGGALGIGVADRVVMLSHSIYSVISPEGCASILWKTAEKAEQASEALALTAEKLQKMGIVEYVVDEGEGAHLDPDEVMYQLKAVLKEALNELQAMEPQARCEARYQRLMKFGSDNLGLAS
ncbi:MULTISPECIES: acetyl-CoA carboxylase carboxyltransferase subunit alpha [Acinetobacter]|uniref:Acetyl-coenzyme A carboxylase carboxyl transferase subunit alpha n=2 Tax=Acinetobacter variabilis TaxID=70346 RepID=N9MNX7_9GAMM|nr:MULTISPECIES: acetyl-CoA carboxylase carboxyltransferase subunit alpha [Acinetobacter]EXA67092.1 acetyl-CoA carboxylase, carboxyl transferase, alpha subunit [Acinetobacter baumannii 348935]HCL60070.1 acetyl-CoA carboxylase carboxyltransferase subunit alpha [Acinetobacter sp.]AUX88666.1 acetyl-CoA carboxylase carboxyltransferase subunit alpha [Acinetobacter sp. ACNIH1]ENU98911.1 acetyl-coenzyme A carboxylase carboxyl transferase subunit alpha [Acinetobacter variabilis]ENX10269.1 acetyl-coenz